MCRVGDVSRAGQVGRVVNAGLLVHSSVRLISVDGGFEPANVLTVRQFVSQHNTGTFLEGLS